MGATEMGARNSLYLGGSDSPDLARVRSSAPGYMSAPFSDEVELSMRLGCVVPTDAESGK